VVAHDFTATKTEVLIQTRGSTVTTARYNDRNPIINAVTLESLGLAPVGPRIVTTVVGAGVTLTFESISGRSYTLEYKGSLFDATWSDAGTVTATGATSTLTDNNAAHRTAATGFWRIRANP
jgi:hypothetical protein